MNSKTKFNKNNNILKNGKVIDKMSKWGKINILVIILDQIISPKDFNLLANKIMIIMIIMIINSIEITLVLNKIYKYLNNLIKILIKNNKMKLIKILTALPLLNLNNL
jgi:hypothetical protein